jgi:enoyl-CoA hydratase
VAVRTSLEDGVRWVVLDRPEALNALTAQDIAEITRIAADPGGGARALAFAGAGGRAFCSGVHTASFLDLQPSAARTFITRLLHCLRAVRTSPLPTVAMIDGWCLGAGFELALTCDLRVATPASRFGLPEVKVGIPSVIDAALLPQYVGLGRAKEIILTGDDLPAADADRLGLLNRVVDADRLRPETEALLARVTRHTATVLASQKRVFEQWLTYPPYDAMDYSTKEFARVFRAAETHEQIRRHRRPD